MNKYIAIVILAFSGSVIGETNSYSLGEAIGGYLIANDMFEKLSNSGCGYTVKKNYNFHSALKEILP